MNKQNIEIDKSNLNVDEILKQKRKAVSHCINLECQKEQLLILIDKLYNISSARMNILPEDNGHNLISKCLINAGSYLYSIGDQLTKAQKNRKNVEAEISEAKKQIESLDDLIKNKKTV